jgi:hypothetical protein
VEVIEHLDPDRLESLVAKSPNPEQAAQQAARATGTVTPDQPNQAGQCLVQHNLELRTAIDLQIGYHSNPWPIKVMRGSLEVKQAMEETTLEDWSELAASMASASNLE